jgi:hypothetical protein
LVSPSAHPPQYEPDGNAFIVSVPPFSGHERVLDEPSDVPSVAAPHPDRSARLGA